MFVKNSEMKKPHRFRPAYELAHHNKPPPLVKRIVPDGFDGEDLPTRERAECTVCLERPVYYALDPCGHYAICRLCALQVAGATFKCPICRADVVKMLRTHNPT